MPCSLARPVSASTQSRTCPGPPASASDEVLRSVCTESTARTAGRSRIAAADHLVEVAAGTERQRRSIDAQPPRPARDLSAGLLARGDQAGVAGSGQARHELEEEGRLADAGRPCEQHDRAGDQPAAQDAVDPREPRRDASLVGLARQIQRGRGETRRARCAAGGVLTHASPFTARGAPAGPLPGRTAAPGAHEQLLELAHRRTVDGGCDTPPRDGAFARMRGFTDPAGVTARHEGSGDGRGC